MRLVDAVCGADDTGSDSEMLDRDEMLAVYSRQGSGPSDQTTPQRHYFTTRKPSVRDYMEPEQQHNANKTHRYTAGKQTVAERRMPQWAVGQSSL